MRALVFQMFASDHVHILMHLLGVLYITDTHASNINELK